MSEQSKAVPVNKNEIILESESAKSDNSLAQSSRDKLQNEASAHLSSPPANKPYIDPYGDSIFIDKMGKEIHLEATITANKNRDVPDLDTPDQNNQMSKSEMQNRKVTMPSEQIVRDKDGNVTRTIIPGDQ